MITDNSNVDLIHNYSAVSLALGIGYAAYYWLCIAKRPLLAGNIKWQTFIHSYCPLICRRFLPTFWCPSARVQTILRIALKTSPRVPVKKEFLDLSDGGHVSLDWLVTDAPEDTPIVLILPGLIGNGDQSYALHLQKQVQNVGYRSVVFSYRGNGGAHLKTAKTYTACETGDLASVVQHIKFCYPHAPLAAVGVSLGGLILTNYLAKHGSDCDLLAGMTISSPWDLFKSSAMLEEPINRLVFNWPLCSQLKATIKRSAALFEKTFNLDHVLQSRTIRDFDNRFTAPLFGYGSIREYYDDARIDTKIHNIEIPLLALNSTDDPFSPANGLPLDDATKSKCVVIVATSHGGHIGFLEGLLPTGPGYMDRVFAEYICAIFQHGDELRAALQCTKQQHSG